MRWYFLIILPVDAISDALCLPVQRERTRMKTAHACVHARHPQALWSPYQSLPLACEFIHSQCLVIFRKHNTSHRGLVIRHKEELVEMAYPENRKHKLICKPTTNYSEDRKGRKCGSQYENHAATMIKTAGFPCQSSLKVTQI